jgi:hypothetical protein
MISNVKLEFRTFKIGAKLHNKSNFLFQKNDFNDKKSIYIRLFKLVGLYITYTNLSNPAKLIG